jgi:hypothetical protein
MLVEWLWRRRRSMKKRRVKEERFCKERAGSDFLNARECRQGYYNKFLLFLKDRQRLGERAMISY